MRHRRAVPAAAIVLAGGLALTLAAGATAAGKREKIPPPPEMTEQYLADPEVVATGKVVWEEQCRHCHGKSAYPGKAPKLRPRRYRDRPDFVWDRVTNGFRKMPAWDEVYTPEERMAVVAYIISKEFSP